MTESPRTVTTDEAYDLAHEVRNAWEEKLAETGNEDDFPEEQQETSYLLDALEAGDAAGSWKLTYPDGTETAFTVA